MPRIRTIKPDFFLDEDVAELKHSGRLAFIGLWCEADKAGRLEDRPRRLKATIFPYERADMDNILDSLNGNFIIRYEVEGRRYIQINNFLEHQRPHHTEKDSIIPPVPGGFTVKPPLDNGETSVGKEGKGREGKAGTGVPFYLSFKGIELTGFMLESFNLFWGIWRHPRYGTDKSRAADSFISLPWPDKNKDTFENRLYLKKITFGAEKFVEERETIIEKGDTPPYAQRWLHERRFEVYITDKIEAHMVKWLKEREQKEGEKHEQG